MSVLITVPDEGIGRSGLECHNFHWNPGEPFPEGAEDHKVVYFKFSGSSLRWIKRMIFLMSKEKTLVPKSEGPGIILRKATNQVDSEDDDSWMEG
jgi:hypothetical protein